MNLVDCDRGEEVLVKKIHAPSELKRRLISFGIMKGVRIAILEVAPAKATMELKVDKMRIALRREEAAMIEVERI